MLSDINDDLPVVKPIANKFLDLNGRHPDIARVYRFFAWQHLPEHLAGPSRECAQLAATMIETLPDSPELTVGLRKLMEAKDCFVRAAL